MSAFVSLCCPNICWSEKSWGSWAFNWFTINMGTELSLRFLCWILKDIYVDHSEEIWWFFFQNWHSKFNRFYFINISTKLDIMRWFLNVTCDRVPKAFFQFIRTIDRARRPTLMICCCNVSAKLRKLFSGRNFQDWISGSKSASWEISSGWKGLIYLNPGKA